MKKFNLTIIYKGKKHPELYGKEVNVKQLLKLSPYLSERVLVDRCWEAYDKSQIAGLGYVIVFDNLLAPTKTSESRKAMNDKLITQLNNEWLKKQIV
tara:strand:- start:352 stop:642 length:291 start_codon:yes stop_codon:yes gene_type:complete